MQYYKNLWVEVDKNMDKKLDSKEIRKLLENMNFELNEDYFKMLFAKFDKDKSGCIEFEEFIELMNFMREHKELNAIFNLYKD